MKSAFVLVFVCGLPSCGTDESDAPAGSADLPAGWEDADRIPVLTQTECREAEGDPVEAISAVSGPDGLRVEYLQAHFRCAQAVEGFFRETDGGLDLLIQPVEMNPESVAKCLCRYDLGMSLSGNDADEVTVYRRWDNLNRDNDPVRVGSAPVAAGGE